MGYSCRPGCHGQLMRYLTHIHYPGNVTPCHSLSPKLPRKVRSLSPLKFARNLASAQARPWNGPKRTVKLSSHAVGDSTFTMSERPCSVRNPLKHARSTS